MLLLESKGWNLEARILQLDVSKVRSQKYRELQKRARGYSGVQLSKWDANQLWQKSAGRNGNPVVPVKQMGMLVAKCSEKAGTGGHALS